MNRIFRRLTASALVLCLFAGFIPPAAAYDAATAEQKADALKAMSLLRGSDRGYELDRAPTRMEAIIMLIRLLGEETTALYGEEYTHPFTDAPGWEDATKYLAYAYSTGLTTGADATHFDPESPASAQMFSTFVLRALGYRDSEQGSVWDNWQQLLADAMTLPGDVNLTNFLRGDMVSLCYAALDAKVQGSDMTLSQKMVSEMRLSELSLRVARVLTGETVTADSELPMIMAWLYAKAGGQIETSRLMETDITDENIQYYLGTDSVKIVEGLAAEPMMLAMAHSVCLLRLPEGADVEAAKKAIRENVDPRKWICVGVDEGNVFVESIDNLVLLAMDNEYGNALANAFRSLDSTLPVPDANGMMKVGDTYIENPAELDSASIALFTEKMTALAEANFPENNVYLSIIPDKSYYARAQIAQYLSHDAMMGAVRNQLFDWNLIDIADELALDDFYLTDPHWKQEELLGVVNALGEKMGFSIDASAFSPQRRENGFTGSYGRLVDGIKPETITWLTSPYTEAASVSNMQTPAGTMVYNTALLEGSSAYDIFLSGLSPLTVINCPNAKRERHLVLFSDSYGSSLAPLLLEQYSKITVVDLRYLPSKLLSQHVDFTDADILLLYSAAIVNNSNLLK